MTDDKKLNRESFFAQTTISVSQKIEVFFSRNAADVEQANLAVGRSEFFKKRGIAATPGGTIRCRGRAAKFSVSTDRIPV